MDNILHFMLLSQSFQNNQELIENLTARGLLTINSNVWEALTKIPRGVFIPNELQESAYHDTPLRYSKLGFNISAPHMYATCLTDLELYDGLRFLDIGCGSGHFSCCAAYLVGPSGYCHGIDIKKEIIDFSMAGTRKLQELYDIDLQNVQYFQRNCFLADPNEYVYDRIYVGSSCPRHLIPIILKSLSNDGIMLAPVDDELVKYTKVDGTITKKVLNQVRYSELEIPSDYEIEKSIFQLERCKKLKVQIQPSSIGESFNSIVNNSTFSNIHFLFDPKPSLSSSISSISSLSSSTSSTSSMVEQKIIYGHKLFFSHRAPEYYKTLKIDSNVDEITKINIPSTIDYESFISCLRFIYSGELPLLHHPLPLVDEKELVKLENIKECAQYLQLSMLLDYIDLLLKLNEGLVKQSNIDMVTLSKDLLKCKNLIQKEAKRILNSQPFITMDNQFVDLEIEIENQIIKVNKIILGSRSNYFKSLIESGMSETYSKKIKIQGPFSHSTFMEYLLFLYCGNKCIVNNENVIDLIQIADYFNDEYLKSVCEDLLVSNLDLDNVCRLLQISYGFNANQLSRVCIETIIENFNIVSQSSSFKELDKEIVVSILSTSCKYFRKLIE